MSTTVASLLSLPVFQKECTLLAGEEGLGSAVRYVTVMEAPDFNIRSLTDNVFVLTTLSSHCASMDEINKVVTELCQQNVSAICIKLGRFIDTIDESTIRIAREHQTPLFALTKNVLFREIISDILSAIVLEQQSTINELNELNEQLLQAILHNHSMEKILSLLTAKIPSHCCCLNQRGVILARHASMAAKPEESIVGKLLEKYLKKSNGKHIFDQGHYLFPCIAHGQVVGYLLVYAENTIFKNELTFIVQMVSFLAIKFLEEHLQIQTEQRMTASVLDEILFVNHADEAAIADRLQLLGVSPKDRHIVMLLSNRTEENTLQANSYLDYWRNWLQNKFEQFIVFIKGTDFVVLISYIEKKKVNFSKLAQQMRESLPGSAQERLDIGFSLPVSDLRKLPDCYSQAKRAVNYGRAVAAENHVYPYAKFVEIGLISRGVISSDGEAIREKIVRPIQNYDEQCNAKLWNTLEKCLLAESLDLAAKTLSIHISTLRYRLQKIHQLTDVNFFTSKGRFILHLAYILFKADSQ
ncbi:PucR family transcriptional regulator [Oleispirillum naphthae]|uniref:PucR family transcriptional regulator n=1 Tax=Oleispirillum naphthae TaxID=2838853 RepID=UPI0030824ECB